MNIHNIFKKKTEKRGLNYVTPFADALTFGSVNSYDPMMLSAVYRCVELISNSIAILPIKLNKISKKGEKTALYKHAVLDAFNDKKRINTRYTIIKKMVADMLTKGNGYLYINKVNGRVIGLEYIDANDVTIQYNKFTNVVIYTVSNHKNILNVAPDDMVHIYNNSYDGIRGISILSYANKATALSQYADSCSSKFFKNGMNINGIITVQGNLTAEQQNQIKQNWQQVNSGENAGLAVLNGNMSYQSIQANNSDSQMLETRVYNTEEIARFFGINPILLSDLSHTTNLNLEDIQNEFLVQCLQPYISIIEAELNKKLIGDNENVEINLDENYLLRTNKSAQASYYNTLLTNGTLSINEVRKELGYEPIDNGDTHYLQYSSANESAINNNTEKENKDAETV